MDLDPLDVPILWLLLIVTSVQCALKAIIFPQFRPDTPLTTDFPFFFGVNAGLWLFWTVFIYPFWCSPLRHLPHPKVRLVPS